MEKITSCTHKKKYNELYDARYCPTCDKWIESRCSDSECSYCRQRPERPSLIPSKKLIKSLVKIALNEIGEIKPWYDQEYELWIFEHSYYPVECSGSSIHEVLINYPKYLYEFINARVSGNLAPEMEAKTLGLAGKNFRVI